MRLTRSLFNSILQRTMELGDVVKCLQKFAPLALAADWDNVGLLVEPSAPHNVNTIMVTNDLTEDVLEEVLLKNAELVIAYHPPIFSGLKRLTQKSWKERIIARCLENRVAIFAPHTTYDALAGGMNDWLASAFAEAKVTALTPNKEGDLTDVHSHKFEITFAESPEIEEDVKSLAEDCRFYCRVLNGSHSLSMLVMPSQVNEVSRRLRQRPNLLPYVTLTKLEQLPLLDHGAGRICELKSPITLDQAVEIIKIHLQLDHIRLAVGRKRKVDAPTIRTVAVCPGSGGSVFRGCVADLWWTGEMSHHDVLDAVSNGTSVVLCEHSNTERGYLRTLTSVLSGILPKAVTVLMSERDKDPLTIV